MCTSKEESPQAEQGEEKQEAKGDAMIDSADGSSIHLLSSFPTFKSLHLSEALKRLVEYLWLWGAHPTQVYDCDLFTDMNEGSVHGCISGMYWALWSLRILVLGK